MNIVAENLGILRVDMQKPEKVEAHFCNLHSWFT